MKYLYFFNENLRGSMYGIGTYVEQIIKIFKNSSSIRLIIIQLSADVKEFCIEKKGNYDLFLFPGIKQNEKNYSYYRNIWYILYLKIKKNQINNPIFHLNYDYMGYMIPYMKSSFPNCKIIYTIHFQRWCFTLNGNKKYFKKLINTNNCKSLTINEKTVIDSYKKEVKLYNNVDKIISLSKYTCDLLHQIYKINSNKIVLNANGIEDIRHTVYNEEGKIIRTKYLIDEDEKIILFVGRLDDIKGVDYLLMVFKEIVKFDSKCRLILAGEGDFSKCLKQSDPYWSKITYLGLVEKHILYDFYTIADVGIQFSLHEQCSFVSLEMMMFNIPIVAFDLTGLSEMIKEEKMKIKIKYNDLNEIIFPLNKSVKAISDVLYNKLSLPNNRQLFEQNYTLEKMAESYFALLSQL